MELGEKGGIRETMFDENRNKEKFRKNCNASTKKKMKNDNKKR